jgi:hypothetical protein
MAGKPSLIEVDEETAAVLKARAAARGLSVSALIADLVGAEEALPPSLAALRDVGEGPWSPKVLAEDARRIAEFRRTREAVPWEDVKAWIESWGKPDELSAPKPRKL